MARSKGGHRGRVLFIDARKLGSMVDHTHRELTDEDIVRIAGTYHSWRGENVGAAPCGRPDSGQPQGVAPTYADIPGYCKSATVDEIRKHGYVLTPGRYVGTEKVEDDAERFIGRAV